MKDHTGTMECHECKASATAPFAPNQKLAHPEIAKTGGVVVGKGKPGIPGGTVIPPATVKLKETTMTVSETGVVDWLGIEKGTGQVSMTLVDDLDWSAEQEHLLLLEEKLNAYLAFIESGEVFERLAADVGRQVPSSTPIKVTILGKYELTTRPRAFLDHAIETFKNAGFSLAHRVVKVP